LEDRAVGHSDSLFVALSLVREGFFSRSEETTLFSMECQTDSPAVEPGPAGGNSWTLPLVLAASLAITATLLVAFRREFSDGERRAGGAQESKSSWSSPLDPASETVALEIDFGNGAVREFAALAWREGMTVADLMAEAARFSPGIRYTQQGEGAMALLTSLDGVANGAPADRFWLYEVNGQPGTVSFAMHKLSAGDRVLWAFKPPE
jgi:hypothetical protein